MNYLNIKINSSDYYRLNKEEKLKCIKTKLAALFNDKGNKNITIIYKGKKKTIPYEKKGFVKDLIKREKALEKEISPSLENDLLNRKEKRAISNDSDTLLYTGIGETFPLTGFFPFDNSSAESASEDLSIVWENGFKENNNETDSKIKSKPKRKKKIIVNKSRKNKKGILAWLIGLPVVVKPKNRYKGKCVSKKSNISLFKNGKIKKSSSKKEKRGFTFGIVAIPFVKKIMDKRKSKNNLSSLVDKEKTKRRKTAIVTWALITSLLLGGIGLAKKGNKNSGKIYRPQNTSVTDVWEPTEDAVVTETSVIVEESTTIETQPVITEPTSPTETEVTEPISSTETEPTNEENKYSFSFDDSVTINDGASIYYSSYDAVNNDNELNPLFDGSYIRSIDGIVYSLDGNIYTIYSNDVNAYQKAQELIEKGAKEEALLVTRSDLRENSYYDNQYEGYYDVDDVKVLTRHK